MTDLQGKLYTPVAFGPNGEVYALRVNASGELLTVVSGGAGSGTPAQADGKLITPLVFDPDGLPVGLSVDAYGYLKIAPSGIVGGYTEGARAYSNANQTVYHDSWAYITLNQERWDTDTIHNTVTNNTRLTCKTAGVYTMWGGHRLTGNATGTRQVAIRLNGVTVIANMMLTAVGVANCNLAVAGLYKLAVNDYVELGVYQNSGITLYALVGGNYAGEFGIQRVG